MLTMQEFCTPQSFACLVCHLLVQIIQPDCRYCEADADTIFIQGSDSEGNILSLKYNVPSMVVIIEGAITHKQVIQSVLQGS
ncbi:hypothetical protein [Pelotomaculum propionicicum]|uniref:Uncharacterized protein n=1 Tax=Pelotomaculum propionicicum TaxID=258475 RepID=A0A4Y7RBM3_9FIRM|nr:hypothetical protein [Pelotomaculum propionicicum]TEB06384.1 hypothetical protein Pmgp_03760 [Pelotomaculum propionicicum]